MVALKSLATASLALLPAASHAEQLFYNGGTLDGWDYVRKEHNGNVEAVTNVVYGDANGSALKMSQRYDESYDGRYHSEVDHNDGYKRGQERFYGFAFRLSEEWEFTSQGYNIAQFIADREGAGCGGDDWMPSTMIYIDGDQLTTRRVTGEYRQPDCSRDIVPYEKLATVTAGDWHTIVLQAKWASDDSGVFKMWFDGEVVVDDSGVATTVNDDEAFQFRVGLYANSWYDDGHMEGDQDFRQVWYDEVAVGESLDDVNPQK